ncbi:MAG: ABC transporter substrate-binding protein [Treponema sp.]|nr:ABC transporter substrate-binding protein [Treponema sp.]
MKKSNFLTCIALSLIVFSSTAFAESVKDGIGRTVTVKPGTYKNVVCIGAGALRLYSYIGDVKLLCGVEDIDNLSLKQRPKMFDGVARPYLIANQEVFKKLPSCGTGGPKAQTAEAEKILNCNPDIVISEYEDADKANALQEQLGVPVITLKGTQNLFDKNFSDSINLLGVVFKKGKRAKELLDFIAKEKTELEKLSSGNNSGNFYICGLGNWGTTNHLMTSSNYPMFKVSGIKNICENIGTKGVFQIEQEKLVSLGDKIDVMIIDAAAVKNIKPLYKEDPAMFDSIKAWNNGEVYLQMAYNAYYTNHEIALINAWFAASLSNKINLNKKIAEITKMFNGKDLSKEISASPASYGGYQKIDTKTFFN